MARKRAPDGVFQEYPVAPNRLGPNKNVWALCRAYGFQGNGWSGIPLGEPTAVLGEKNLASAKNETTDKNGGRTSIWRNSTNPFLMWSA